ncbi:MAG: BrnT family toxin [Steroidobacteraceae bacterium]
MVMDDDGLQFCWDDTKAAANLEKHDVSFEAATYVFDDPMRLEQQDAFAEGEYRSRVIGRVDGILVAVIYTALEDDLYRIISARFASPSERDGY